MSVRPSKERLAQKRREVRRRMVAYLLDEHAPGPDHEYDALKDELITLERNHPSLHDWDSPAIHVLPTPQDSFATRVHNNPMLSLSNAYSAAEMQAWETSLKRLLPGETPSYVAELKIDGLALAVHYVRGELVSAVTRGDGNLGEEVTRNVKTIRSLPHKLSQAHTLEVRGEVYYPLRRFAKLNAEREQQGEAPFKNPRNAAAGTLRMLDTVQVGQRPLDIAIYGLTSPSPYSTHSATLDWLERLGLPVVKVREVLADLAGVLEYHAHWSIRRDELDYHIDGMVVKLEHLPLRERVGSTSKSPRWAIAYKFSAEQAHTTLEDVHVQVGRTGVLTPIALLKPVLLGGATISRATLHNYDQIARLDLRLGDVVILEKGGDIIPKIIGAEQSARQGEGGAVLSPPGHCPSCQAPVSRLEGEVDIYCVNSRCPTQGEARIRHFVSRRAMDIDSMGPALIAQLLKSGFITTYADLYRLQAEQLTGLERMAEKSAQNAIAAIAASRGRPLDKFIHALGIRHVGERLARVLAMEFQNLETLQNAELDALEAVRELGEVTARSVKTYFADADNRELINQALAAGVAPVPVALDAAAPLAGKTVVITGSLSEPRGRWKTRLETAGATISSVVSAKTDYLLAGKNPGSKLAAAQRHEVLVLDEQSLQGLLK